MFWNFIFYGMIAVGAILFVSLTIYRIDWARHPEKYKDLVEEIRRRPSIARKKRQTKKLPLKRPRRRKSSSSARSAWTS